MWAWVKLLLNPMNWAKAFSVIQSVLGLIRAVIEWHQKRAQEKKEAEARAALEAIERANQIQDDEARLRAQAEAACRLERVLNPDADCMPSEEKK